MKPTKIDKDREVPFSSGNLSHSFWIWVMAATVGFLVRSLIVLKGNVAFSSDEVMYYHYLQSLVKIDPISDFSSDFRISFGIRRYIILLFYYLTNFRSDFLPFLACLLNVYLYLLWAWVLTRRTGKFLSALPVLILMMVPPPCITYLGTQLQEIRPGYFYGAIFILFAGNWFSTSWRSFAFGLIAAFGCTEDPFTVFFVFPALWMEKDHWTNSLWPRRIQNIGLFGFGWVCVLSLLLKNNYCFHLYETGYLHGGPASVDQWIFHAKLVLKAWPLYWFGGLPWGYLQNSTLGRLMIPIPNFLSSWSTPFVFWILMIFSIGGCLYSFSKTERVRESVLWLSAPCLLLLVFVFGSQAWDAQTLRYLGFWQLIPGISIGLWAATSQDRKQNFAWKILLVSWAVANGVAWGETWKGPEKVNPAQCIAIRLENAGWKAGFSNYWVSETVRFYSNDKVLLVPYDQPAINPRVNDAVRNEEKIALVWVQGLDSPEKLPVVERQLFSLGFRPSQRVDFKQEGWSILGWEKWPSKPAKGRL